VAFVVTTTVGIVLMKKMWGKSSPWKTEAAFWTWVRGGLRRSAWNRHPVKLSILKEARYKAPIGVNGKDVWACRCAVCGEEKRQAECQVDHIIPAGSIKCIEDITPFVTKLLFVLPEDLRVVCKWCNSVLAYAERYGLTFEKALGKKKEIARRKK